MSTKIDLSKELSDLSVLKVRDKLDYGELVRIQINRCSMAKTLIEEQPAVYVGHVKSLLSLIVGNHRDDEFLKKIDACSKLKKIPKPQFWSGVVIRPIRYVVERVTDYEKVYDVCLDKFNLMGLMAKIRPISVIGI